MSLFTIFQISSQGMTAQRERLETAAANLANSNTTRTEEGGPYRRRDVVFESVAVQNSTAANSSAFGNFFDRLEQPAEGVRASTVVG
ncbi:MAG: flagellar basal body protein, partial [Acidobacteriota bacterium]|nr:flagellar basal body protein [Acidobacteriota bacterium]